MMLFNINFDDVRLSLDLTCSSGHEDRSHLQISHKNYVQECGRHMGASTFRPMVIRTASLNMQRPSEENWWSI